jgi:hypothetical protein
MFYITINNLSAVSWQSVLLVEGYGIKILFRKDLYDMQSEILIYTGTVVVMIVS